MEVDERYVRQAFNHKFRGFCRCRCRSAYVGPQGFVSGRLLHFGNPQPEESPTPGDHRLTLWPRVARNRWKKTSRLTPSAVAGQRALYRSLDANRPFPAGGVPANYVSGIRPQVLRTSVLSVELQEFQ